MIITPDNATESSDEKSITRYSDNFQIPDT